jgi:hypothetical protein
MYYLETNVHSIQLKGWLDNVHDILEQHNMYIIGPFEKKCWTHDIRFL